MKTLDEVIKVFTKCFDNTYNIVPLECEPEYGEDALNYLKMYRSDQIQWEADRENWRDKWESYIEAREIHLDAVKELKRNDPLSWEQLKQMEDKPVWVEVDGNWYGKFWAFVEVENDAYVNFYQKGQDYPEDLWKRDIGKTWQAFKKERG